MTRELNASIPLPLPERIASLPINERGFPVPWFVQWHKYGKAVEVRDGEPDFRVIDTDKLYRCANLRFSNPPCWICGQRLGRHRVFAIGPMCAINRVISEPPSHRECAEFAVRACPFLVNPRMRRNANDLPEHDKAAGLGVKRNPGVTCLWETDYYTPFEPDGRGKGILFRLGEPRQVDWYCEGRAATRIEVLYATATGLPILEQEAAREGPKAKMALEHAVKVAIKLVPAC